VVQSFRRLPLSPQTQHSDSDSLSKREEEVLSLVAQGYINKEIADMTGLSVETVRSYLKNIYKKLHVRSRTAAAMKYFS
jgi:DNA-binding NarL/FixJ family response regulator